MLQTLTKEMLWETEETYSSLLVMMLLTKGVQVLGLGFLWGFFLLLLWEEQGQHLWSVVDVVVGKSMYVFFSLATSLLTKSVGFQQVSTGMAVHCVFDSLWKPAVGCHLVLCSLGRDGLSLWNGIAEAGWFWVTCFQRSVFQLNFYFKKIAFYN